MDYSAEEHIVKILSTEKVTHDVIRFNLEKPEKYSFVPGQATDICINQNGWKNERRPFTFTSLSEWDHLEFTIKIYQERNGVTNQLSKLKTGDELILHDVFGAIHYKSEGTFIAGGAGITPFIAILRRLSRDEKMGGNQLLYSNKTEEDIILRDELLRMLGNNFINTLTKEKNPEYDNRKIDYDYLKEKIIDFSKYFYICGPDPMIADIKKSLLSLGAEKEKIIIEEF
jgi:ferredoxin-NADP reductase